MFTEAETETLMRGNGSSTTKQPPKPNFHKIDSKILDEHAASLKGMGFTVTGLKKQYDEIPFDEFRTKFRFGLGTSDLPKEVYSGSKGLASDYIDKRIEILNELVSLFQSVKGPEDLHKITAFLEMSKKAATKDPKHAAHYIEAIEAAKVALGDDKEARQNFKDYEKSFIYDQAVFSRTLSELTRRRDALVDINKEGFNSDGFWEGTSKHGLKTGFHAYGYYQAGAGICNAGETWGKFTALKAARADLIAKGITAAKEGTANAIALATKAEEAAVAARTALVGQAPIAGRILAGLQSSWKFVSTYAGKAFKYAFQAIPPQAKIPVAVAVGIGVAFWGVSKVVVACNDKNSFLNNVSTNVGKFYYGNANSFTAATVSWLLPGFGTMYGTGFFTNEREKKLQDLKEIYGGKAL